MTIAINEILRRGTLLGAGFVSNRTVGGAGLDEGFGLILMSTLLGAFVGLVVGLMCSHVARYLSFLAGRPISGTGWTICSVVLGALLFAWLAAVGGESEIVDSQRVLLDN